MIDWERARTFEGRCVSIALCDGSRIDYAQLVSAGRPGAPTVWLFCNGGDVFVRHAEVLAVWEADGHDAAA